ncbi:hypothetical protein A9261_12775 [Vibrio tasmaniensis]|nr:hypothetical protein A9261_12775 [Vibrio tasmaniensis]
MRFVQMIVNIITQMEAGGAQGAAVRNSEIFNQKGCLSEVWFLYKKRDVYSNSKNVKVLLDRVPNSFVDYFFIIFKLWYWLLTKNVKSVICYTHYANVIGAICARFAFINNVVVSHRNPVNTYPLACRLLDKFIGNFGFYKSIIVVSQTVKNSFSSYSYRYNNRIHLIYNGIDSSKFKVKSHKKNSDIFTLVSTGRLHSQKNQLLLLKSMIDISDAKLIIAGDGELKKEFREYINKNGLDNKVELIGELPPNKVNDFLAIGDVFLFPSNYEAFGFSVVEAMAAGLPIVASDIPAMREIVDEAGILLDKSDVLAWTLTIKSLKNNYYLRSQMADKSVFQAKKFDLKNMSSSYLKLASS